MRYSVLLLSMLIVILYSCAAKKSAPETVAPIPADAVQVKVIDYRELDGCGFMLEKLNGDKLEPVNLDAKFHHEGIKLMVTFTYFDGMSVCMAGRMVKLTFVAQTE